MILHALGTCGPYPRAGGACSGYLIEGGGARVLLDCGTGTLARLVARCPVEALDAVILSHLHYDHMSDMLPMQYALAFSGRKASLPVYAPTEPEAVHALLRGPAYSLREIGDEVRVNGLRIAWTRAAHPVPATGVRLEAEGRRLFYTGDTNWWDGLTEAAQGADLLLADAGLLARDWTPAAPHLSAKLCGELARCADVGRLLLTHLSPRYAPEDVLAEARGAFEGAQLAVELSQYAV